MQVEIWINDKKADVDAKTEIAETKQINDFFEIKNRQTSYTNTFKLPMTETNKSILGAHGIIGVTALFPYRIHKVAVYRNGIPTITDGFGYLKESTNGHYDMYVYSENIDLFEKVKDKTIADLKINHLDHELNIENWINSFYQHTYTYAVADYGYTENDTIVVDYQVPSLFVKYIWDKIFQENGFRWKYVGRGGRDDYNPFATEDWKKLAFTIDEGLNRPKESINPIHKLQLISQHDIQMQADTVNIPFTNLEVIVNQLEGELSEYIKFQTQFDPDGLHIINNSGAVYLKSRIKIQQEGFYKFNINGYMYNHATEALGLYIEKNNEEIFIVDDDFTEGEQSFGETYKLYLRSGDELFVKVKSISDDNQVHYAYEINFDLWLDNSVNYVNFKSYFSNLKQKDFIKDIVNYFGLIYRRNGKTYEFISIEELLNPLARYAGFRPYQSQIFEDWSDKFNELEKIETKIGDYAKTNLFKYKYINENDTYANATLKIDDETLNDETTLIERIFKAPDRAGVIINNKQLSLCDFYKKEYEDDGSLKDVKVSKTSPFFFLVEKEATKIKYKVFGATNENSFNGSVPFMRFNNLDFNSVLPLRYSSFANMISYGVKYTAQFYLNNIDIHQLDFFKLKYVKQLGGIFYLNKINNFVAGKHTTAELIKVRMIEHKGEFSDDFSNDLNI